MDGILFDNGEQLLLDPRVHNPKDKDGKPVAGLWIRETGLVFGGRPAVRDEGHAYEKIKGPNLEGDIARGVQGYFKACNGGMCAVSVDNISYVSATFDLPGHDIGLADKALIDAKYENREVWVSVTGYDEVGSSDRQAEQAWRRIKKLRDGFNGPQPNSMDAMKSIVERSLLMNPDDSRHPYFAEMQSLMKPNFAGCCGQTPNGKTWFMTPHGLLYVSQTVSSAELGKEGYYPLNAESQKILGGIEFASVHGAEFRGKRLAASQKPLPRNTAAVSPLQLAGAGHSGR